MDHARHPKGQIGIRRQRSLEKKQRKTKEKTAGWDKKKYMESLNMTIQEATLTRTAQDRGTWRKIIKQQPLRASQASTGQYQVPVSQVISESLFIIVFSQCQ